MQCKKPILLLKGVDRYLYPDGLKVPCGKCYLCRIQKRKEWTMRLIHELNYWDKACFVTFTYNDKNLPENKTLVKTDLQKLFKRLRKAIEPRKIKYYACGEYGEPSRNVSSFGRVYRTEGERPHYHAIIFGIGPDEYEIIEEVWNYGFVKIGCAEPDSIRYVSQYIDKKFTGDKAKAEYEQKNREPVFKIQSLGIGERFVLDHKDQFINNESITLFGVEQGFPRYYIKKLGLEKKQFRSSLIKRKEIERVKKRTGKEMTEIEFYRTAKRSEWTKYSERLKQEIEQDERNFRARAELKVKKL